MHAADLSTLRMPLPAQPSPAVTAKIAVLPADKVKADALNFYRFGHGNGETTHWDALDPFWKWLKKEINICTGYPNHGKSRFVHHLMLIKAARKQWRFLLYVAENEEDFYVDMAQMLVGRTANISAGTNRMTMQELTDALDWILQHFVVVTTPEGATPKALVDEFVRLDKNDRAAGGKGFDGILIDPWNQLSHEFASREDLYLSEQLSMLRRVAKDRNWSVWVTAHPAGNVKDKNGKLVCPDAYSISGGKMWNNKADNVLAVYRPAFPDPTTELLIHKIKKQGRVGRPGTLTLSYNIPQSRYYPEVGDMTHPLEAVSFNAPGTAPRLIDLPPSQFDGPTKEPWDA